MQHINELKDVNNVNLVVFDVDGVIVPRGAIVIERGNSIFLDLKFAPEKFIDLVKELLNYTNVAISSGRNMVTLKTIFSDLLGAESNGNIFLMQGENGGRLSYGVDEAGAGHDPEKMRLLAKLRKELRQIENEDILGYEPKESLITIHARHRIPEIEEAVIGYPHYILWNGEAYDIGQKEITKGSGLGIVKKLLEEKSGKNTFSIAIGDRQNDIDLLEQANISVSADKELLKDADYYIESSNELPGVILAEKLLKLFKETRSL